MPIEAWADAETASAYAAYRLVRGRKFHEAIDAYDEILKSSPNRADLWVNRGVALQAVHRLDEAVQSFTTALKIRPGDVGAHINRGAVYGWLSQYPEAVRDYNAAVTAEPDNVDARIGRSVQLSAMGRNDQALADTDHALSIALGHGGAHYNKSLILLSLGDYAEGFREHEWRFGTNSVLGPHRFRQPVWFGEPTDKRILVWCEQGLGDNLQFCRYLEWMKNASLNVIVEAPASLVRLFEGFGFPVIKRDDPLPEFDLHCPMMSFGAVFGTTLETVPRLFPYLKAPADETEAWRKRLSGLKGKKVGISWSSGVRPEQPIAVAMQRRKSIPTKDIAPLLSVPGVVFVSLQKDVPEDGIPGGLFDPMPEVRDLAGTAAIIKNLDLVITVDSAVAHLAGALNKPVWVLNRYDICWRWLSGETKSPWYPSARIYRQSAPSRWDDVLYEVKRDLHAIT